MSKAGTPNSGVDDVMDDDFGTGHTPGLQVPDPITDEELEEVEAIESGLKPHERIAQATAEKTAVPETAKDIFVDHEFSDGDIITEDDDEDDMRVKSSRRELSSKEIRFIIKYYTRKGNIRNIIVDFEDSLPENMVNLGRELLTQGFIWAAEEARASLRNQLVDLPMCDLDMIHAAFKYIEKGQHQQVRAIIDRFSESKNLDGSRVLDEQTIDNLETLLNLYNSQLLIIPLFALYNTTPPST